MAATAALFTVGSVNVYPTQSKKESYRVRWRVGEEQNSLTVGGYPKAQEIAFSINRDLENGIYNSRDYYDPKKAVLKAQADEKYKSLR